MAVDYYKEYPELFHPDLICYPDDAFSRRDDMEIVGKITKVQKKQTKRKKENYAVVELSNGGQTCFITLWPTEWSFFGENNQKIGVGSIIKVTVGIDNYQGGQKLICKNLITLDELRRIMNG